MVCGGVETRRSDKNTPRRGLSDAGCGGDRQAIVTT
jgi:hypothetical protein